MLHVDIPTVPEIRALMTSRADACVSIFLATTPNTQHVNASRIELGNLSKVAKHQLEAIGFDKRRLALLEAGLSDLEADDAFWRVQANSLAVLATPDSVRTFRFATAISSGVEVSDRFHLKPLLRAIAFPQHAFVLALSEDAVRLVEIFADHPPVPVKVPGLAGSAADAVGRSSVNNLTQGTRIADAQGQTILLRQYARQVDSCLRPVLAGRETPLILAAAEPLGPIFRAVNSYPALAGEGIGVSPDHLKDHQLAEVARSILDGVYAGEIAAAKALFQTRLGQGRATANLGEVARAATFGAVDVILADIDTTVPGTVDDSTGVVTLSAAPDAVNYDVVDEIVGRAVLSGAKVLGVRRADIPDGGPVAAVLRFPV